MLRKKKDWLKFTCGSRAILKTLDATVNKCSSEHVRETVITRNILLRNEQLPSNTLIVSSSLSSLSLSFLSLSFSDLCVESDFKCEPELTPLSAFEYSSSRKREASPLLNSSDMLRAVII